MKRPLVISLAASIVIAMGALAATLGAGWAPRLGLDLAGGSQVVYAPAHKISSGQMATTISVIRNRIDGAGVSGAQVQSQGGNVVVQLPNIKNPQSIIDLVGNTAQMLFRPVLCNAPAYTAPAKGAPAPAATLPACGTQYQLTRANLNVTPSSSSPNGYTANQVPVDPAFASYPSTAATADYTQRGQTVLLPGTTVGGCSPRCVLGPAALTGSDIASAQASFVSSQWVVNLTFKSSGAAAWNSLAQTNFHQEIGIDLGGTVISAPLTQPTQGSFTSFGSNVQISGGFSQTQAKNLALDLTYGALPVKLNQVNKQIVTPSLGKSSLRAGLAAGIGGLILVLLYMIVYYRALGIVVVSGLVVTGGLLWAIISAFGHSGLGLTLDLAGVTGLIVSVGITVDSYIVYFERLKDDARGGRSIRTSVDRSFKGAFRTVLAADLVSLAAAVVLYVLSVGTVRGFAFFLGLSTLLDVFITYFFTRPLVILLGRSRAVTEARFLGIARGLAIQGDAR
ncbi:MAG: protein translocase subunit SecD [Actinomycetota bacterium]|jgi:preprotein translocase subunit SecD|nr:protein translocase subunit SecD [Actinomycetota bacterium]